MVKACTYILENDATVQSLVGEHNSGEQHKVFPVIAFEDSVAPYIVLTQIGTSAQGKNCDYLYTIQMVSYANSYDAVTTLNQAAIDAIVSENSGTVNSVRFGFANFINEVDGYDKDHNLYMKISTFEVLGE